MTYRIRRQAGGTVLGLIIGLIIGLGIAVAVAVTITKAPVPLSNRMARPDKPAFDPAVSTDPNKPLYGKRAAPSTPPATAAAPAVAPAAQAAIDEASPANTAAPVQPATESVPVIEKSIVAAAVRSPAAVPSASATLPAISADKAPAADSADDKYTYYLQAGAFRERADADNTRAKLALLGFEARISERQSDSGTLYRVRVGPVSQMETINKMRSQLSDGGVDAAVVRVAK